MSTSTPPHLSLPTLLAGLPQIELSRLLPALERVRLKLRQVLYQPGEPIAHVYFPIDSLVSLLTVLGEGGAIETGLVGRDGLVGLPVFLRAPGADRRAVCQQAGDAWRMGADAFRAALDRGGVLAARLLAYADTSLRVAAQFGACGRLHEIEARCASTLLMVADRVGAARFRMTQQTMAETLGVRRASVLAAFAVLAQAGLIENRYGWVIIVDRPGLERAACECYHTLQTSPARARLASRRPKALSESRSVTTCLGVV